MARAEDERIGISAAVGLGALVLATFVAITTEIVPVGLLPQLSRAFSVSEAVTGLLVTVYAGLVAVLAIPLTRLTGRVPRKPLLLGTIVLYSVGNAMIAFAPAFAVVCVGEPSAASRTRCSSPSSPRTRPRWCRRRCRGGRSRSRRPAPRSATCSASRW